MILFLGAGASKPFGIKIMGEREKWNPRITILFRDKESAKVIRNLQQIKQNIILIESKFGEEEVFEDLKQKLSEA